jgi:hypothetical protein
MADIRIFRQGFSIKTPVKFTKVQKYFKLGKKVPNF